MTSPIYGWCGKILKVDLSHSSITEVDTKKYADRFLGGRGIATRIYWDEVKPETGAFDPDNRLILMSGPLGTTGAQGASRFEVVAKSPMLMPEGFCYGNLGGYFGPFLKRAGFDGIVVSGKAEKPSYIRIDDDRVEILDAAFLWGKGTNQVRDALRKRHGGKVHFVTTGVAGENLCRNATLMTDNDGGATGGFGAVMGSKNLKAIAVTGTGRPAVADLDGLRELNRRILHLNKRDPMVFPFPEEQVRHIGKSSCYQCGMDCSMRLTYRSAAGIEAIRKCQAMFVYLPWVGKRPGESLETAFNATGICNELALCTMEMYNVVEWLESCFDSGYLTEKETGLDPAELGSQAFFEKLAGMIARREGFGEVLAEGLLRAGEHLGQEAKSHFSNAVSAVGDGSSYSPREYIVNGLLYALEPRQPIAALHETSRIVGQWVMNQGNPESSPVTSDVLRAAAEKFWGSDRAWDLTTHQGKAMAATRILDRTYVKDSLLLCDSSWPLMVSWNTEDKVGDPALEARVFSAVTGLETDEAELRLYGERIFNLQRAVLLREGWQPKGDDLPADFNFNDPVETVFMNPGVMVPGPGQEAICLKGNILDKKAYHEMRDEFYRLRGWDTETGFQKTETLDRLDLSDVAEALKKMGRVKEVSTD
ncbi:MAG: hypothetical protein GY866_20510 [Proteobacteria bacterium]|nr:hypothetical protein [Pseudomonadota bacterium]